MWARVDTGREHWIMRDGIEQWHSPCGRVRHREDIVTVLAAAPKRPCKVCLKYVVAVRAAGNLEEADG